MPDARSAVTLRGLTPAVILRSPLGDEESYSPHPPRMSTLCHHTPAERPLPVTPTATLSSRPSAASGGICPATPHAQPTAPGTQISIRTRQQMPASGSRA
jgi:hypothetical protein